MMDETRTSGVINSMSVGEDGSIKRIALKVPRSTLPAKKLEVGGNAATGNYMFSRVYTTPVGNFEVIDNYFLGEVNGKTVRRTFLQTTISETLLAEVSLGEKDANGLIRSLKAYMTPKQGPLNGQRFASAIALPENVKGEILHMRINPSGSRVTVVTSEGQEVEMALSNFADGEVRVVGQPLVRDLPNGIADLLVESKTISVARSSVKSGTARGLEVDSANTAASH